MNSLKHMENHLRGIAKRYKRIQFSTALAVVFLMLGVKAFAEMGSGIEADSQLEVMQLLKQEDQVTKSPREFWEFGLSYQYNKERGQYHGK